METKRVKRKRLNVKKLLILLLFLYLIINVVFYVFKLPIKNIYIDGNTYISDSEIINVAKLEDYPAIFRINKKKNKKEFKKIEFG